MERRSAIAVPLVLAMISAGCGGSSPLVSDSDGSMPSTAPGVEATSTTTAPVVTTETVAQEPTYLGDTPEEVANAGEILIMGEFQNGEYCTYDPMPSPQVRVLTFRPDSLAISSPYDEDFWNLSGSWGRIAPNQFFRTYESTSGRSGERTLTVTSDGFAVVSLGRWNLDDGTPVECSITSIYTRVGDSGGEVVAPSADGPLAYYSGLESIAEHPDWGWVYADEIYVMLEEGAPEGTLDRALNATGGQVVGRLTLVAGYVILLPTITIDGLDASLATVESLEGIELAAPSQVGTVRSDGGCSIIDTAVYGSDPSRVHERSGLLNAYRMIMGSGMPLTDVHVGVVDLQAHLSEELPGGILAPIEKLMSTRQVRDENGELLRDKDGKIVPDFETKEAAITHVRAEPSPYVPKHANHVLNNLAATSSNGGIVGVLGGPVMAPHVKVEHANAMSNTSHQQVGEGSLAQNAGISDFGIDASSAYRVAASAEQLIANGAKVINLSVGPLDDAPEKQARAIRTWLEVVLEKHPDVTFVVAAGNSGQQLNGLNDWFAGHPLPNVITVTANDGQGQPMDHTHSKEGGGTQHFEAATQAEGGEVTLSAVGQNVPVSVLDDGSIERWHGTSFAAPQVAGAIALMRSLDPTLRANEIKQILVATAQNEMPDDPEQKMDPALGAGQLRIDKAVLHVLKERLGYIPTEDELIARGSVFLEATNTAPGSFDITATLEGVEPAGTTIDLVTLGPGSYTGADPQDYLPGGVAHWGYSLADGASAVVTATRFDTGACASVTLAETPLAGTYAGMFGVVAEGYGVVGEIPFEIRVSEDLSLTTHLTGTIDVLGGVYTTDFVCNGHVNSDGSAECTGDGVASFAVGGQTQTRTSTITGTGQITGDVFDFTVIGLTGPEYGTAFKVYP